MTAAPTARWRHGLSAGLSLVSGASLAIVPAAVLSLSAHTFPVSEQGILALAITAATFLGQLVFGATVEARLSTDRSRTVATPPWLLVSGGVATVALALAPLSVWFAVAALPLVLGALEVGRGVSVVEERVRRETMAALAVGTGAALGVLLGILGIAGGFAVLAAGVLVAIVVRSWGFPASAPPPDPTIRRWVLLDVALTGIAAPLLNASLLALLGPFASTLFAAVSTVSGLLAIPLNFLRSRLLRAHGTLDIAVTVFALAGGAVAIAVAELTGLLGLFFGETWTLGGTALPLLFAAAWRVAALFSAIPFAALRRAGRARLVTVLRGSAAAFTFALATASTVFGQLWIVFAALTLGELVLAATCEIARRSTRVPLTDPVEPPR
jgi:hypothetical protein